MTKFKASLVEMPPQTTRTGKTKLDRNGNPLRSIQIDQGFTQRQQMLDIMENLAQLYVDVPYIFPDGKHHVGNDPMPYSVEEMFVDALDRMGNWRNHPNAHIYKSFIDRHNWMLDRIKEYMVSQGLDEEAEYAEQKYRIDLRLPPHVAITNALRASPIFEVL